MKVGGAVKKFFTGIRDWIKNYGYAYKVTAIVIAVILVIAIYFIVHYATLVHPDYVVIVTTQDDNLIVSQQNALKTCLEEYGEDLNNDGKISVEVVYATLWGNQNNAHAYAAERTRLSAEIYADRWGFVAFDAGAYDYMQQFKLLPQGEYQDESGAFTVWNWKGSQLYEDVNAIAETTTDLYFGVRNVSEDASDKVRQAAENGKELLERIISGSKTNPRNNAE